MLFRVCLGVWFPGVSIPGLALPFTGKIIYTKSKICGKNQESNQLNRITAAADKQPA